MSSFSNDRSFEISFFGFPVHLVVFGATRTFSFAPYVFVRCAPPFASSQGGARITKRLNSRATLQSSVYSVFAESSKRHRHWCLIRMAPKQRSPEVTLYRGLKRIVGTGECYSNRHDCVPLLFEPRDASQNCKFLFPSSRFLRHSCIPLLERQTITVLFLRSAGGVIKQFVA